MNERQHFKENHSASHLIIYTDLDGTMLDPDYTFTTVGSLLPELAKRDIPIIFVTTKNATEIKTLQTDLGMYGKEPFIVENGHAIYIPNDYFSFALENNPGNNLRQQEEFMIIDFGTTFPKTKDALEEASKTTNVPVLMQSSLSPEEFAETTGLSLENAKEALQREYQEGFEIQLPAAERKEAAEKIAIVLQTKGYSLTAGGRFYWVNGQGSKGKAVRLLSTLYQKEYQQITTVGLGDAPNDVEFLSVCDKGYLVQNPDKAIPIDSLPSTIIQVPKIGPAGWKEVVEEYLEEEHESG